MVWEEAVFCFFCSLSFLFFYIYFSRKTVVYGKIFALHFCKGRPYNLFNVTFSNGWREKNTFILKGRENWGSFLIMQSGHKKNHVIISKVFQKAGNMFSES